MIIYDANSCFGYGVLCHMRGSVFCKVTPQATLAMLVSLAASLMLDPADTRTVLVHPSPVLYPLTFALGFLLVYRSNLAYQRFWESRTHIAMFSSKMGDVAHQIFCFLGPADVSLGGSDYETICDDGIRLVLLMHKLALMRLSGNTQLQPLVEEKILSEQEADQLRNVPDRFFLADHWLHRRLTQHHVLGGLVVAAPVFSRTFQVLSEAHMFFNQARKVRETPFPFPYAQLLWLMLHLDSIAIAFVSSAYVTNPIGCAVLVFAVVMALFSVNQTAMELEAPFSGGPNAIPLLAMDDEFVRQLMTLSSSVRLSSLQSSGAGLGDVECEVKSERNLLHDAPSFSEGDLPFTISALRVQGSFACVN